jgi:hypothetical protein
MHTTWRTGILGCAVAGLALAGTVAKAQTPGAPPSDATGRRIVIVPAGPDAGAPSQPAERHIVIVPAQPDTGAASQPAERHIVIVPTHPDAGAASQPGNPRIVIVPAQPGTQAAPPASHVVIIPPSAPPASQEEAAPEESPSEDGQPPDEGQPPATAATPEQAPEAPYEEPSDDAGDGDGMRTITASPDLSPSPNSKVAQPATGAAPELASAPAIAPDGFTDGHPRLGPFLSGPGSLTFILHHTFMGAAGGFATQGLANDFSSDTGGREALLAGTLVGAGIGFGTSSWWQFNHWMGTTSARYGVLNSVSGGMFLTGLLDLTTDDPTALAWSSLIGAELGGWLTAGVGGGDMPFETGLLLASGESWGAIYGALLLAVVRFSGSSLRTESALDTLFITQGAGALLVAFASSHFHPTARQIIRADISGAVVGGAVLLLSALVLGHLDSPTPYILSMASSATTMALVSVLWDAGAESPQVSLGGGGAAPYRSVW